MNVMDLIKNNASLRKNSLFFKKYVKEERNEFAIQQKKMNKVNTVSRGVILDTYEKFNIFYPKVFLGDEKIIVNIHGGNFVSGNKDFNNYFNGNLSKEGYVIISVDYPLIPDATIKEMIVSILESLKEAMEILSKRMNINKEIYLMGDDAGALLCLYMSAIQNNEFISELFQLTINYKFKGLALISGLFFINDKNEKGNSFASILFGEEELEHYGDYVYMDYLLEHAKLVPMYVFTCQKDRSKTDAMRLFTTGREFGQSVSYKKYTNMELIHDFQIVNPDIEETKDTIARIMRFFDRLA